MQLLKTPGDLPDAYDRLTVAYGDNPDVSQELRDKYAQLTCNNNGIGGYMVSSSEVGKPAHLSVCPLGFDAYLAMSSTLRLAKLGQNPPCGVYWITNQIC